MRMHRPFQQDPSRRPEWLQIFPDSSAVPLISKLRNELKGFEPERPDRRPDYGSSVHHVQPARPDPGNSVQQVQPTNFAELCALAGLPPRPENRTRGPPKRLQKLAEPRGSVGTSSPTSPSSLDAALTQLFVSPMSSKRGPLPSANEYDPLDSLSKQYYNLRKCGLIFSGWCELEMTKRSERKRWMRLRKKLSLRCWNIRTKHLRFGRHLPMLKVLASLAHRRLSEAWSRMRKIQALRAVALMKIFRSRIFHAMAVALFRRSLLLRCMAVFLSTSLSARKQGARPNQNPVLNHRRSVEFVKRGALLRSQQLCFQRWFRIVEASTPNSEYLIRKRQAALLLVLRSRCWASLAVRQRVKWLQHKVFMAFRDCLEEAIQDGVRRRAPRRPRPSQTQPGLRGTSRGEVLRKGWHRWRYIVSAGIWVTDPLRRRPVGLTVALCSVADKIAETRRARKLPWPCPVMRRH